MKLADDVDAPFKLYAEDPQSNEISDVELFRTMKQRNPEMFTQLKENVNQGLTVKRFLMLSMPRRVSHEDYKITTPKLVAKVVTGANNNSSRITFDIRFLGVR